MNLGLLLSAFVDVLIASAMIFYLRKNMTGFRWYVIHLNNTAPPTYISSSSRGVVQTLMFFSINTEALTMQVAIIIIVRI